MLALDSAKSGNQKGQVLRAVTFNSAGKGTPKVTLLKGLSSVATFSYSTSFGLLYSSIMWSFFLGVGTLGFSLGFAQALSFGPSTWYPSIEVC